MRGLKISSKGEFTELRLARAALLYEVKNEIGGWVTTIRLPFIQPPGYHDDFGQVVLLVDEEAELKNSPVNAIATILYTGVGGVVPVLGDVVMMCETDFLSGWDFAALMPLVDEKYIIENFVPMIRCTKCGYTERFHKWPYGTDKDRIMYCPKCQMDESGLEIAE